jgi:hypothetical protein
MSLDFEVKRTYGDLYVLIHQQNCPHGTGCSYKRRCGAGGNGAGQTEEKPGRVNPIKRLDVATITELNASVI